MFPILETRTKLFENPCLLDAPAIAVPVLPPVWSARIKHSVSSLKSAVVDSPNVELTMLDSLLLRAPMSEMSIVSNLPRQKASISDAKEPQTNKVF